AAAGEAESALRQHPDGVRIDRVARIGEGYRRRNAVRGALRIDGRHLLLQSREVGLVQRHVIARVVPDFETVAVQRRDLLPREVVLLVRLKGKSLADEKRRAEPVFLQQRTDNGVMTRFRVIEGQYDQLVWYRCAAGQ